MAKGKKWEKMGKKWAKIGKKLRSLMAPGTGWGSWGSTASKFHISSEKSLSTSAFPGFVPLFPLREGGENTWNRERDDLAQVWHPWIKGEREGILGQPMRGEGGAETGTEGLNKAGMGGWGKISQRIGGCPIPGSVGWWKVSPPMEWDFPEFSKPRWDCLTWGRDGWENGHEGVGNSHKSQNSVKLNPL